MRAVLVLALVAVMAAAVMGALELTQSNFDAHVHDSGKSAFVKFLAPWCGHCKNMKPAWDQLAEHYDGSSVGVFDVDCTVEKELCQKYGVSGYPTIKYFTSETGKEGSKYQGGRSFDVLKEFVEENLAGACDVNNAASSCNQKEQDFITKMNTKSADEKATQLTRLKGMADNKMAPPLKAWLTQRIAILEQMVGGKDEL